MMLRIYLMQQWFGLSHPLLERHHLRQGLFEAVQRRLREQGYHLSKGTRVNATLIQASGSTKNQARERDREMRSARKGGWSVSSADPFGYRQVRYKGLAKNRAQVISLVALANIYLLRRSLMAA